VASAGTRHDFDRAGTRGKHDDGRQAGHGYAEAFTQVVEPIRIIFRGRFVINGKEKKSGGRSARAPQTNNRHISRVRST